MIMFLMSMSMSVLLLSQDEGDSNDTTEENDLEQTLEPGEGTVSLGHLKYVFLSSKVSLDQKP